MNAQTQNGSTATEKAVKTLSKGQKDQFDKLPSKSAKIRYLNGLEWTRSEIASYLNIRYQHVRNVLITPVKTQRA